MRHVWFLLAVAIVVGVATEIPSPLPNSTVIRASSLHATFQKLTPEENEERLGKCGQLNWPQDPSAEPRWQALANYPWLLEAYNEETELETHSVVVISKRHVVADRNVIRQWNLTDLFGNDTPRFRASVAVPSHSTLLVTGIYCTSIFMKKCTYSRYKSKPAMIFVDDVKNPKTVVFEMTQEIPIPAVCMPEQELKNGDEVFLQHRESPESSLSPHRIREVHPNGWVEVQSNSSEMVFSHVLIKKEHGRFTLAGNNDHYTRIHEYLDVLNLRLFRSVFGAAEVICELTGVCASPPHVDLTRISREANEKRLKSCGRLPNITNMSMYRLSSNSSSNFSLARQHPWYVVIDRSDGFSHSGLVVSQRHILVDWFFFNLVNWKSIFRIHDEDINRTISTNLPVIQNGNKVLDYSVTAFRCNDEQCESPRNETLLATKIMVIPGSYAVLEMEEDIGLIPVCLLGVHGVSSDQVRISTRGSEVVDFGPRSSEKDPGFDEVVVEFVEMTCSALHFADSHGKDENRLRSWKLEAGSLCVSTGVCPRGLARTPLTEKQWQRTKWTEEENERRRNRCGIIDDVEKTSGRYFGSRDAPWLVGVKPGRNSSTLLTGVVIAWNQVLVAGPMFENPEDLADLIGDYRGRHPQELNVLLPDYRFPDVKMEYEFLVKSCKNDRCDIKEDIIKKPDRVILDDSTNPTFIIFELEGRSFANNFICLEELNEVERNGEILVHQFRDTQTTVVNVTNGEIETGTLPPVTDTSKILVRFDGNRFILAGFSPRFPSSPSRFLSAYSIGPRLCALTGICPPKTFPVQIQKITEEENRELLETCGFLKTRYPSHNSTRKPSIARDAPWLVKLTSGETQLGNGFVISRRHVLTSVRSFLDVSDYEIIFGYDWLREQDISSLPFPRTHLTFSVTMRVCNDAECDTEREEVRIPTKVASVVAEVFSKYVLILEFDRDLPVPPICFAEDLLNGTNEVYIQSFDRPETLLDKRNVSNRNGFISVEYDDNYTPTYSEVMTIETNGTYGMAAFYLAKLPERESGTGRSMHMFLPILSRKEICHLVGVCSKNHNYSSTMPPNIEN